MAQPNIPKILVSLRTSYQALQAAKAQYQKALASVKPFFSNFSEPKLLELAEGFSGETRKTPARTAGPWLTAAQEKAQKLLLKVDPQSPRGKVLRGIVEAQIDGRSKAARAAMGRPVNPTTTSRLPDYDALPKEVPGKSLPGTLSDRITAVMGTDELRAAEVVERLTTKGWAPVSNDPVNLIAWAFSQNPHKIFEKVKRGVYRVRPQALADAQARAKKLVDSSIGEISNRSTALGSGRPTAAQIKQMLESHQGPVSTRQLLEDLARSISWATPRTKSKLKVLQAMMGSDPQFVKSLRPEDVARCGQFAPVYWSIADVLPSDEEMMASLGIGMDGMDGLDGKVGLIFDE
jgi:hypothetical protein